MTYKCWYAIKPNQPTKPRKETINKSCIENAFTFILILYFWSLASQKWISRLLFRVDAGKKCSLISKTSQIHKGMFFAKTLNLTVSLSVTNSTIGIRLKLSKSLAFEWTPIYDFQHSFTVRPLSALTEPLICLYQSVFRRCWNISTVPTRAFTLKASHNTSTSFGEKTTFPSAEDVLMKFNEIHLCRFGLFSTANQLLVVI